MMGLDAVNYISAAFKVYHNCMSSLKQGELVFKAESNDIWYKQKTRKEKKWTKDGALWHTTGNTSRRQSLLKNFFLDAM